MMDSLLGVLYALALPNIAVMAITIMHIYSGSKNALFAGMRITRYILNCVGKWHHLVLFNGWSDLVASIANHTCSAISSFFFV